MPLLVEVLWKKVGEPGAVPPRGEGALLLSSWDDAPASKASSLFFGRSQAAKGEVGEKKVPYS